MAKSKKPSATTKKKLSTSSFWSRYKVIVFGVLFGIIGVAFVNLVFAASDTYTYKQELSPQKLTQTYGFTLGVGPYKAELKSAKPMQVTLVGSDGKVLANSGYSTTASINTQVPKAGKYEMKVTGRSTDITAKTPYTIKITNKDIAELKRQSFPDGVDSFPDASNTGWQHTGVTLSPSGSITASKEGQVIDSKDINGCVTITAKNVVIKRSRIRCAPGKGGHAVYVKSGNVTIEDTEIAGTSENCGNSVAFSNYKLLRVNIHGCLDGVKANGNVLVEGSYIHDQRKAAGSHNDGVQTTVGSNIVFRRNRIDGPFQTSTSAFIISTSGGKIDNYVIENNYLSGGGYMVYVIDKKAGYGAPTNVIIRDNTVEAFSMNHSWITYDVAPSLSGNKWNTGELIKSGEKRGPGS